MRRAKILLVGIFLLAILTVSAVSASENIDNLTVTDGGAEEMAVPDDFDDGDIVESCDESENLKEIQTNDDNLGKGEITEDNFDFGIDDGIIGVDQPVGCIYCDEDIEGMITVSVEGSAKTYESYISYDNPVEFFLSDLNITAAGIYNVSFNFKSTDGQTDLDLCNCSINVKEYEIVADIFNNTSLYGDNAIGIYCYGNFDGDVYIYVNDSSSPFKCNFEPIPSGYGKSFSAKDIGIDAIGSYEILIKYISADGSVNRTLNNATLHVNEFKIVLWPVWDDHEPESHDFVYDDTIKIKVIDLPEGENTLRVFLGNKELTLDDNHTAELDYDDLIIGKNVINATLTRGGNTGPNVYYEFEIQPFIGFEGYGDETPEVTLMDDLILVIIVPDGTKGNVTIYDSDAKNAILNSSDVNGTTQIMIPVDKLQVGLNDICVVYENDGYVFDEDYFVEYMGFVPFIIYGSAYVDDDYFISVNLPDNATGNVIVFIDGKKYYNKTVSSDNHTFIIGVSDLDNPLSIGRYEVLAQYVGDDYGPVNQSEYVNIHLRNVFSSPDVMSEFEKETVKVNLPSQYGGVFTLYQAVYDVNEGIYVCGRELDRTPVVYGKASIPIYDFPVGENVFFLEYSLGDYIYNEIVSINVVSNTKGFDSSLDKSSAEVGDVFIITFKSPVSSNQSVEIKVDDKLYNNFPLTAGTVYESIAGLAIGNHRIKIFYDDGNGTIYSNTFQVTVKEKTAVTYLPVKPAKIKLTLKKVKVKKSAKKLVLKATLKINNNAKKGLKVTFKFNGKKFTAKTNKKGVAKVTIKKKYLKKLKVGKKVKYQVSYGKKTVKRTAIVKK